MIMKQLVILGALTGVAVAFQPARIACNPTRTSTVATIKSPCSLVIIPSPERSRISLSASASVSKVDNESNPFNQNTVLKSLLGASLLVVLDIAFRRLLESLAISFPSALAGCGVLFATFLFAPGGAKLYDILSPGAALLAKWLPLFFVPSLITLPLADSVGSASEVRTKIGLLYRLVYCHSICAEKKSFYFL